MFGENGLSVGSKTVNGVRRTRLEQLPQKEFSKCFYGTLTLADGRKKQLPLIEDEKSSRKLLVRLQIDEDKKKALGITDEEQRRFRDVQDALNEYVSYLTNKGNTSKYVKT